MVNCLLRIFMPEAIFPEYRPAAMKTTKYGLLTVKFNLKCTVTKYPADTVVHQNKIKGATFGVTLYSCIVKTKNIKM